MKLGSISVSAFIACAGLVVLESAGFMPSAHAQSSMLNTCVNSSSGEVKIVPEGVTCHKG